MISDLSTHCGGRSIRELATGRMSYLELGALLAGLPPESALRTAQRNKYSDVELAAAQERARAAGLPHGPWSHTDSLLAALIDTVGVLINVQIARAGQDAGPLEPVPRPGVVAGGTAAVSPQQQQVIDRLAEIRRQHDEAVAAAQEGASSE